MIPSGEIGIRPLAQFGGHMKRNAPPLWLFFAVVAVSGAAGFAFIVLLDLMTRR